MATGLIPDTTQAHSHDATYVNVGGDTMTGNLLVQGDVAARGLTLADDTVDVQIVSGASGSFTNLYMYDQVDGGANIYTEHGNLWVGLCNAFGSWYRDSIKFVKTTGATIFNPGKVDQDTSIKGVTDDNLIYADASVDRVGIGTNTPAAKLDLVGTFRASATTTLSSLAGTGSRVVEASSTGMLSATNRKDRDLIYDPGLSGAVAEIIATGVFTSAYRDYEIEISEIALSAATNLNMRLYSGASPSLAAFYGHWSGGYSSSATILTSVAANTSAWLIHGSNALTLIHGKASIKLGLPAVANYTVMYGEGGAVMAATGSWDTFGGMHGTAAAFDGVGIYPATGTIVARIKIYGVR